MNIFRWLACLVCGVCWWGPAAAAGEVSLQPKPTGAREVAWHQDIAQAWQATKQQGRPLLVFVTRDQCYYCDRMKDGTYASPLVASSLESAFVPLLLDGRSESALLRELQVRGYPSTFVISPQAVVLDRIDGYVTPEVLASRLQAIRPRPPSEAVARDP